MRLLALIRHAHVDHRVRGIAERERRLDATGHAQAAEMGRRLADAAFEPDLLLVSSARRAVETAEALAAAVGLDAAAIDARDSLFHAPWQRLMTCLAELDDDLYQVGLVGHHPGIAELGSVLSDGRITGIPYAGVAWMELVIDRWSELDRGSALHVTIEVPVASFE